MAESMTRPHVLMMSEITADGKLTLKKGASSKILMKYMAHETEILLHKTRADCDAIMVGANTIRIDNSFLTVRFVPGKSPIRVIPSSMADIPADAPPARWTTCRRRKCPPRRACCSPGNSAATSSAAAPAPARLPRARSGPCRYTRSPRR